jgi:hypothetical protein
MRDFLHRTLHVFYRPYPRPLWARLTFAAIVGAVLLGYYLTLGERSTLVIAGFFVLAFFVLPVILGLLDRAMFRDYHEE